MPFRSLDTHKAEVPDSEGELEHLLEGVGGGGAAPLATRAKFCSVSRHAIAVSILLGLMVLATALAWHGLVVPHTVGTHVKEFDNFELKAGAATTKGTTVTRSATTSTKTTKTLTTSTRSTTTKRTTTRAAGKR